MARVTIDCSNLEVRFHGPNYPENARRFARLAANLAIQHNDSDGSLGEYLTIETLSKADVRVRAGDTDYDDAAIEIFHDAVSAMLGEAALNLALNADEMVATVTVSL